jgi:amidase
MKRRSHEILKWTGIALGFFVLMVIALGLYVNSILPKFDGTPVALQTALFRKPEREFPMEGKYIYKSATELAAMIKSGQASSEEIVTEFLNHIKNNNYKYNALIYIREQEALEEARKADEAVRQGDTLNKPLLGVPLSIKEAFWVKGSPSTFNAKMYGFTAPRHAELVNQLINAGAIILGTSNVPFMLGDYQTTGEVYPVANNPFDTTRTPGGSTGGGAAAIAAGFTPVEIGTDLGGSIRVPAVFCGLWSLKSTYGVINMYDGSNPDSLRQHSRMALVSAGPLARNPDDLKLIWNILREAKLDPRFQKSIDWNPASDRDLRQYKIAWIDEWETKNGKVKVSDETKKKLSTFIDSLKQHRVSLEKNAPELYDDLQDMYLSTFGFMMGENQAWLLRKLIDLDFQKTSGGVNPEPFTRAIMDASNTGWDQIQGDREALINAWEMFFVKYDFFICPVTYDAAFKKQESWEPIQADDGNCVSYINYVPYTYIINASGHPSITVPLGLNSQGLPIGVQIVGPYYSEPELLHFAKLLEPFTPKFQMPNRN